MSACVMKCPACAGRQTVMSIDNKEVETPCVKCQGKGYIYITTKRVPYSSRKVIRRTYLKPWKNPESLYCSENLGEIINKKLGVPRQCPDKNSLKAKRQVLR